MFLDLRLRSLAAVAAVLLVGTVHADAASLFYESFSEDSLPTPFRATNPDIGGVWISGAANDLIVVGSIDTTGTLAHPASGGRLNLVDNDRTRAMSAIDGGVVGADGTTIYASFLIDLPGNGTSAFTGVEMWDGPETSGNNVARSIRAGWMGPNYAVQTDTGKGSVNLDPGLNFVVLQFNYGAANDDTVDVFVNPTIDELTSGNADGQLTGPFGDKQGPHGGFSFDRVGIGSFNVAGLNGYLDEIRVGTELADVSSVPEPSTLVLLTLGVLALALFGRRPR